MVYGQIAQSVEQRTENPRVGGSIPSLTTSKPFDFVEGLFVYRLNQIESNKIKYRTIRQPVIKSGLFLLYVVDKLERTENPRVGGSIPSLTTSKPFDFIEGLFVLP